VATGVPILRVGNFDRVQIEGEVPEGLLASVAASTNAKVRIRRGVGGELAGEGTVRFLGPMIDPAKRTAHLVVDADNASGSLRPGEFVDLAVVVRERESAVVVPTSAIVREGPLEFVFVVEGKGENKVFRKRDVATGVRDDRVVEIVRGLVPGDVVAVGGAFGLSQLRGFVPGAPAADAPEAGTGGRAPAH
jgi:RND family efflux transporter MFP subunit